MYDNNDSIPTIGTTLTYEKLICQKIVEEDVATHHLDKGVLACDSHTMVFGGRSVDNMAPLSDCE